jgi:hypothetical protein
MMHDTTRLLVPMVQLISSPHWKCSPRGMVYWLHLELSERRPIYGQ